MKIDLDSVDHVLMTTRAVRKRFDLERPVEPEVLRRCVEIAIQAPTGLLGETWHFVIATEPAIRRSVADVYCKAVAPYNAGGPVPDRYLGGVFEQSASEESRMQNLGRIFDGSIFLADHLPEVPALIVPCVEGRPPAVGSTLASLYGSIIPAAWSLCLALRSRGLASLWTTVHISHEEEMAEALGLPPNLTQVALIAVGYLKGEDLKVGKRRRSVDDCIHWNRWGDHREP